jgi:hypothetical protein
MDKSIEYQRWKPHVKRAIVVDKFEALAEDQISVKPAVFAHRTPLDQ